MKISSMFVMALVALGMLSSCKKESEVSVESQQRADQFDAFVQAKQFQVKEYYSDKPIDYNEDDAEVKSETNLFNYVSTWIKDDGNVFDASTGTVTVFQNSNKFQGISAESFTRNYSIGADRDGVYFDFLNYQYDPLRYRLVEFAADYFIVYADWHSGAKVFTRFQVVE